MRGEVDLMESMDNMYDVLDDGYDKSPIRRLKRELSTAERNVRKAAGQKEEGGGREGLDQGGGEDGGRDDNGGEQGEDNDSDFFSDESDSARPQAPKEREIVYEVESCSSDENNNEYADCGDEKRKEDVDGQVCRWVRHVA